MARSECSHGFAVWQLIMFLFSALMVLEGFGAADPACAQLLGLSGGALCPGAGVAPGPLTPAFPPRETLDFPRSWLLPVLRDYVQGARLSFFTSYFLPLAATLKSRGKQGDMVGVPEAEVLHSWELQGPSISFLEPSRVLPSLLLSSSSPSLLQPWSLPRLGKVWRARSMTRCSGRSGGVPESSAVVFPWCQVGER